MADEIIKIGIDVSSVSKGLEVVSSDLTEVQKKADGMSKTMTKGVEQVNMSLGEMKRELRSLRNESFMGKTEAEIKAVRARMADLTDQIGDFQKQVNEASTDRIPAMINGLRGIVAGVQGVTATLQIFGIENSKLEKSMMALINASMALTTVYDLYEKQTMKVAAAMVKDTALKIKDTVATLANAAASNAATKATKALWTVMAANPIGAIVVAVAGLAAGIAYLATRTDEFEEIMTRFNDTQRKALEGMAGEYTQLTVLTERIKDVNLTQTQRNQLVDELQKKYPGYLSNMEIEQLRAGDTAQAYDVLTKAIMRKVQIQAIQEQMAAAFKRMMNEQLDLVKEQAKQQEIANESLLWSATKFLALYKPIVEQIGGAVEESNLKDNIQDANTEFNALNKFLATLMNTEQSYNKTAEGTASVMGKLGKAFQDTTKDVKKNTEAVNENKQAQIEMAKVIETQLLPQDVEAEITRRLEKINEELSKRLVPDDVYIRDNWKDVLNIVIADLEIVSEAVNYLSEIQGNIAEKEMNEFRAMEEEKTAKLEDEYEARLAAAGNNAYQKKKVEEWYAIESEKLNEKLTKQQEELERKQKQQQQRWSIAQAIINGAQGITKIWANDPEPISASILTALLLGVVGTQIGVIASQKFAEGGQGVIGGKYHSEGGVRFFGGEAEKDERWAIFNRQATARNSGLPDLIDAINQHELIIDKSFMQKIDGGRDKNVVVISNFKGGEHLKAIREIMEKGGGDMLMPDGRIKKGIIKRRLN